jgi:hypothetical protein
MYEKSMRTNRPSGSHQEGVVLHSIGGQVWQLPETQRCLGLQRKKNINLNAAPPAKLLKELRHLPISHLAGTQCEDCRLGSYKTQQSSRSTRDPQPLTFRVKKRRPLPHDAFNAPRSRGWPVILGSFWGGIWWWVILKGSGGNMRLFKSMT